jgi:hypothetical protein
VTALLAPVVAALSAGAVVDWLVAYAFTQAIEVPLYLRVADGRWRVAVLASTLTHPIVWFVFPAVCPLSWGYWGMVAAAEAFAVTAEAAWLRASGVGSALKWAALVNAASATAGLLLRSAFGVP